MTYPELIKEIERDTTGIARGYDINFLQEEFCYAYKPRDIKNLFSSDLKLFKAIEKVLLKIEQPKEGDFVEYDGNIARISSIHNADTFQLSNKIGVYVSKRGSSQASGCTWDSDIDIDSKRLVLDNLVLSNKTKKGHCWTFSQDHADKNRGVYFDINFNVWSLNK